MRSPLVAFLQLWTATVLLLLRWGEPWSLEEPCRPPSQVTSPCVAPHLPVAPPPRQPPFTPLHHLFPTPLSLPLATPFPGASAFLLPSSTPLSPPPPPLLFLVPSTPFPPLPTLSTTPFPPPPPTENLLSLLLHLYLFLLSLRLTVRPQVSAESGETLQVKCSCEEVVTSAGVRQNKHLQSTDSWMDCWLAS